MALIVPAPPGEFVGFDDSRSAELADPSTSNLFIAATFDRGAVAQAADLGSLRTQLGGRVNYSAGLDMAATALAEGGGTITASRVTGPAATAASLTLDGKIKITASSPGAWGNALTAKVDDPNSTTRRLVIAEAGTTVAVSPEVTSTADLVAWSQSLTAPVVTVTVIAAGLPIASSAAPLVGGDDDRAHLAVAGWTAALARLDRNYGPGRLIVDATALDVHGAVIEHCAATNRVAELQLPPNVTETEAKTHALALLADYPDDAWRVNLWASHAYTQPVSGEPERLVGWSAVQAGIASRVELRDGIGKAPFGPTRGTSATTTRLYRSWSTGVQPPGEVQRLYVSGVNAAQDQGRGSVYAKGYRTLAANSELLSDAHVAGTRMRLAFGAELDAELNNGEPCDRGTVAEFHARLDARCQAFVTARAFNADRDAGYEIDTESVNTPESLAARGIYARVRFRPNGSSDWSSVLVGGVRTNELLGA